MRFVSHAQNREDVMLWRALKHVRVGFYVDVGANHPSHDSVTLAFYQRGWCGVNIEPLPQHFAELEAQRTRDINLQFAMGAQDGEIELFDTPVRGLATANVAVAELHRKAGLAVSSQRVPMRRLDAVFAQYAQGDVHFLKIDVEGFEAEVLAGMDFARWRPWVVVVEATVPNSQRIDAAWEPQILQAGYSKVYFDGLNRYYLANEHADLASAFSAPPNVFDNFISAEADLSARKMGNMRFDLWQASADLEQTKRLLDEAHERAMVTEKALAAVLDSSSWRITAPLRAAVTRLTRWRAQWAKGWSLGKGEESVTETLFYTSPSVTPGPALRLHAMALPSHPRPPQALFLPRAASDAGSEDVWFRWLGHLQGHYSLAIVNRGLALGLDALRPQSLAFVPYDGRRIEAGAEMQALQSSLQGLPEGQRLALKAMLERSAPLTARSVSVVHHFPLMSDPEPAALRVLLFFWEESVVSDQTVAKMAEGFDAVWVASEFVRRVLRNSGCALPIFVIPMGVDHVLTNESLTADSFAATSDSSSAPSSASLSLPSLQPEPGQPLRFLHVSSAFERKGVDVLLAAFFAAFTANDAVELYIKTFANPHNKVAEQLTAMRLGQSDAPRVVLDESALDDEGMLALYRSAHAMVLPTRGEGFNLPAAEALALGLPLIVTGYGAQADFCTLKSALMVPFVFSPSRSHLRSPSSYWAEPVVSDLTEQMRALREQVLRDDPSLSQRRQLGAAWVRQHYTWANGAQAAINSVAWLFAARQSGGHKQLQPPVFGGDGANRPANVQPVIKRMALISSWHTPCGVAQYAEGLLCSMNDDFSLRVFCDTRTDKLPDTTDTTSGSPQPKLMQQAQVDPMRWALGDMDSVYRVLDSIAEQQFDVLLVQHQPSFFELTDGLCRRLAEIRRMGCVVLLDLHATLPQVRGQRLSEAAAEDLRGLDRVMVHQLQDLNLLLGLGLVNNAFLLPLGVVQAAQRLEHKPCTGMAAPQRAQWGIAEDELVLGTFGFLLPHKGVDTLIECIKPLALASRRRVRLLAVCASLDARSEATLMRYKGLAEDLEVATQVTWVNDFRPIEECVQLMAMADFVVFPYKETEESASAAVTVGLASRTPVLVSPQPIFSDVKGCTYRMTGSTAGDIVAAVCHLNVLQALRTEQTTWLDERSWQRLSSQFIGVVKGLLLDRRLEADCSKPKAIGKTMAKTPKQLLVDVSELYLRDGKTGIQRVVRSVLAELQEAPPSGFVVRAVYGAPSQGYRYTERFLPDGIEPYQIDKAVAVGSGDVFLGLDLSAHLFPAAQAELHRFRLAGAQVYFVVYDMIPLLYPQFTVDGMSHAFGLWMQALACEADGLVCISDSVAQEVRGWLKQNAPQGALPEVGVFHLGADIGSSRPTCGLPENADGFLQAMGLQPSFLMVGTLEPRKGHEQVLDAFELLWAHEGKMQAKDSQDGDPPMLVMVGKEGWNMQALAQRLRSHPQLGRRLFWLEEASDEYLGKLYSSSTCLIAASLAEGFGLPLIEAAQQGLPVIARDIPVFREVAGQHAYYFSGDQAKDLAMAVTTWLELKSRGIQPPSGTMPWMTWKQSTQALLKFVGVSAAHD